MRADAVGTEFACDFFCCSYPPPPPPIARFATLQPARAPGSATQLALCVRSDPVCFVVPLLNWVSWACVRITLRVQSAHQHLQHLCPPLPAGNTPSPPLTSTTIALVVYSVRCVCRCRLGWPQWLAAHLVQQQYLFVTLQYLILVKSTHLAYQIY